MPWTGGAFLVGAMAIAGLPPLNGFASEWLTLQALLHVSAYGGVGDGIAGRDRARRARRDGRARRLLLRQGRRARAARPAAAREPCAAADEAPLADAAAPSCFLALACVVLGARARAALRRARRARAVACGRADRRLGLHLPGTGSLPTVGIAVALVGAHRRRSSCCAGSGAPRPRRAGRAGRLVEPRAQLDERGFTKPLRLVLEPLLRPSARSRSQVEGGVVQEVSYSGRVPQLIDERVYRPIASVALAGARHARRLQSGQPRHLRRLSDRARARRCSPSRGSESLG